MSACQFDVVNWYDVSCLTTASLVSLTFSAKTYFNHSSLCLATDTRMHASCPAPLTQNQSNDSGTLFPLEPGNSLGVPKSQTTSSTGTWLHGILISNSSSVPFKTVFLSFIFFPVKSDMYFVEACCDNSTINTLWAFGYMCWLLYFSFGCSSLWSTISSIWIFHPSWYIYLRQRDGFSMGRKKFKSEIVFLPERIWLKLVEEERWKTLNLNSRLFKLSDWFIPSQTFI